MQRMHQRRRVVWVNGHPHIPFAGYQRRPVSSDPDDRLDLVSSFAGHGLTPAQTWQAQQRLALAEQRKRLKGPWLAARIAGIISAVKGGRVGNRAFGWSMHGRVGGRVMALHGAHILHQNQPKAVRAATIARQRQAAADFIPTPTRPSPSSYLAL